MFEFDPLLNIFPEDSEPSFKSNKEFLLRSSFKQKLIALFRFILGTCAFSIYDSNNNENDFFHFEFLNRIPNTIKIGLMDCATLFIPKALTLLFALIAAITEELVLNTNIFVMIIAAPFWVLSYFVTYVLSALQFIAASALTILCLPLVGIAQLVIDYNRNKLDQEFKLHYAQQNHNDETQTIESKNNKLKRIYKHVPMSESILEMTDPNEVTLVTDDPETLDSDPTHYTVLFSKNEPHSPGYVSAGVQYYFLKFAYGNSAANQAFASLLEVNPSLIATRTEKHQFIQEMVATFVAVAQLNSAQQQLLCTKETLMGYIDTNTPERIAIIPSDKRPDIVKFDADKKLYACYKRELSKEGIIIPIDKVKQMTLFAFQGQNNNVVSDQEKKDILDVVASSYSPSCA